MDKIKKSSLTTQKFARKFSRRTAIKRGAAAAAFVGAAPMFCKKCVCCFKWRSKCSNVGRIFT